jgi:hypothetical protein
MSIIEAASVQVKTMADGTLRLSVDIEPRFARDAFALFGSPGTPMALAALKPQSEPIHAERPKGGELSKWVAMRCQEPAFQQWLKGHFPDPWRFAHGDTPAEKAAGTIRAVCSVESRAEIDNNETARRVFDAHIRGPWQKHCIATGATA